MICPRSFNDVVTQPDHWQEPVSNRHSLPAFQVGPGFEEGHGWVRELERLVIERGKQKTVVSDNGSEFTSSSILGAPGGRKIGCDVFWLSREGVVYHPGAVH